MEHSHEQRDPPDRRLDRLYYSRVIAFIVAVVLTAAGAVVTAGWHVLAKHDPPKFEDLSVGFDILVSAMVMQVAFIPSSRGQEAAVRWAGVGVLFLALFIMAVITRFRGE